MKEDKLVFEVPANPIDLSIEREQASEGAESTAFVSRGNDGGRCTKGSTKIRDWNCVKVRRPAFYFTSVFHPYPNLERG